MKNFFEIENWTELVNVIVDETECAFCIHDDECYESGICWDKVEQQLLKLVDTRDCKPTPEESAEDWDKAKVINS